MTTKNFFDLMAKKRKFIIRLKAGGSSRKMRTPSGQTSYVANIARRLRLEHNLGEFHPRLRGRFGWTEVRFPDREEVLTLVVFWDRQREPVVLLTNLPVGGVKDALRIIQDYLGRWWGCEDPIRFLKDQIHLEKFLVDGMEGIRHWFFWISVAFSLLFEVFRVREILELVVKLAQPFAKKVRFHYYRILRGFNTLLREFIQTGLLVARSP